uniref:IMD domain-containing protein n=1 Tax=Trichobilharzia regenti TaxID=157069 RepID=A0AA85KFU9_TRIRE|nr:unnamed protein product [Trichobilharzia regenti]
MSVYMQNESTNRGGDTVVDRYCNSLNILKEKVMALLEHYHTVIVQKMECDLGNLLTYNAEEFKSHLADVFCQLNEVEFQLNNLESWAGLPPECFTPAAMNYGAVDHDQVSHEAQTLVEAIRHLQKELRGMVTKTTRKDECLANDPMLTSTTEKVDNCQNSTPYSLTSTVVNQSSVPMMSLKSENTSSFHPSGMSISPSVDDTNQKQHSSDTTLPSCFSSNEENRGYPYPNNRPSYTSHPNSLTRSPVVDRRQQPNASLDVYHPSSGQHSSVSPSIPTQHYVPAQYNQYLPSSSVENIPSNRMTSEAYPQQTPLATIPRTSSEQYPPRPTQ